MKRPSGPEWNRTKLAVLERCKGLCEDCGEKPKPVVCYTRGPRAQQVQRSHVGYEFDHSLELVNGGDPLDPANVRFLCLKCHRAKTRLHQNEWNAGVKRPVERPRIDYSTKRNAAGKTTLGVR